MLENPLGSLVPRTIYRHTDMQHITGMCVIFHDFPIHFGLIDQ